MSSSIVLGLAPGPGTLSLVDIDTLDPLVTQTSFVAFNPAFSGGVSLAISATGEIAVGAGPGGGGNIRLFDSAGNPVASFLASGAATAGADVAWLSPTLLAVSFFGAGSPSTVDVYNTTTGTLVQSFDAAFAGDTGGVTVAGIDADHVAVATDGGAANEVKIFDLSTDTVTADFHPFNPAYTGALSISALPTGELAVGAAAGGGGAAEVEIFDASQTLVDSFVPVGTGFTGGVNVAWLSSTLLAVSTATGASEVTVVDTAHGNAVVDNLVAFSSASTAGVALAQIDTTPCYCRGTLIATVDGDVAVETLAIGDRVLTMSGAARPIKWIGRRSFGGRFVMGRKDILPICIKAGALADQVPRRDLWISPHHAMFFTDMSLGGMLIEAKDLINGVSIVQTQGVESVEYFHIELDTHDVIIAEGALSESFLDDDSRGMFHNAHEYPTHYPQDAAAGLAPYCAPRYDDGYEVEAVRGRLAQRAGLAGMADGPCISGLRGYVDLAGPAGIAGWAQTIDAPEVPVCLDIFVRGRLIGQVLANTHREDLKRAGLGSGRHAFDFTPPAGLGVPGDTVEVRRSLDGAALLLSTQAKRGRCANAA
jgi:hypothetical protein